MLTTRAAAPAAGAKKAKGKGEEAPAEPPLPAEIVPDRGVVPGAGIRVRVSVLAWPLSPRAVH